MESSYGSNDIKNFCQNYTGTVNSYSNLKYITSPDCSKYVIRKINSPLNIIEPDYSNDPSLVDGGIYMIKNVASNLYLEVAGGKSENGANVQQWGQMPHLIITPGK